MVKWRRLFICVLSFINNHCIYSRLCLPFYFGEHCIFMRSCLHLPFYFGQRCIFWKIVNAYHFILGSTVNLWEVAFIYHFIMYKYNQREEINYYSFYNPNRPWITSSFPPQKNYSLVHLHIPFPRTAPKHNNDQCSWLSKIHSSESSVHFPPDVLTGFTPVYTGIG